VFYACLCPITVFIRSGIERNVWLFSLKCTSIGISFSGWKLERFDITLKITSIFRWSFNPCCQIEI